mmetsp:Transcript_25956/g.60916  ORF Transcript_25956/g.60916 Transcript_25956/m.60916 type:complete len:123 (+) Transcript_25956:326-694(+)
MGDNVPKMPLVYNFQIDWKTEVPLSQQYRRSQRIHSIILSLSLRNSRRSPTINNLQDRETNGQLARLCHGAVLRFECLSSLSSKLLGQDPIVSTVSSKIAFIPTCHTRLWQDLEVSFRTGTP